MVRGNWQKRVETAEARRKEAKYRKRKTDDKRHYKEYVKEFMDLLDRCQESILRMDRPVLNVWTSTAPDDSPPLVDMIQNDEDNGKSGQWRPRSSSIESEPQKGRGRSGSCNETKVKKVHPRSKEPRGSVTELPGASLPLLCRSHFFGSMCECKPVKKGSGKMHYASRFMTLAAALSGKQASDHQTAALTEAEEFSLDEEIDSIEPGAMEMVYHQAVHLTIENEGKSLGELVTAALNDSQTRLVSLVYASLNGALVYDRNQEGKLLSDREFLERAVGETLGRRRKSSVGCDEHLEEVLFHLPGIILEQILMFLPEVAVATASQVCRSWRREIGCHSPNLWQYFLDRRGWPCCVDHAKDLPVLSARSRFVRHYVAMRDLKALHAGVGAIRTGGRRVASSKEMAFLDFSKMKHAPDNDVCCSIRIWSPNHALAAYTDECCLRLFGCVQAQNTGEIRCKELVYKNVDPYHATKKRSCQLLGMDVDEDSVMCLCRVKSDQTSSQAQILVSLDRDSFLLGNSSDAAETASIAEESELHIIDIEEAVLNFILSLDEVDHRLLRLLDHLGDGGDISDLYVVVSNSIVACGCGRFLLEVSISLDALESVLLDRKILLFSLQADAIVWVGDSYPLTQDMPSIDDSATIAYRRHAQGSGSRAGCTFAVAFPGCSVLIGEIDYLGHVETRAIVVGSSVAETEINAAIRAYPGFESLRRIERTVFARRRPIAFVEAFLVTGDNLINYRYDPFQGKCRISFNSINSQNSASPDGRFLELSRMKVLQLSSLRGEYVLALCSLFEGSEWTDELAERVHPTPNEHRFSTWVVVVHVRSCCEIGRVQIAYGATKWFVPQMCTAGGETIGLALSDRGVVLTGDAVRSMWTDEAVVSCEDQHASATAKKKKKTRAKKVTKKDAFARGMSLRG